MTNERTLLTGFGPFGRVVSNPTARVAERLSSEVATLVLPTSFARACRLLLAALASSRFDRVVMLGVAANSERFRVERFATNWDDGANADVEGFTPPPRRIAAGAPARLPVSTSVDAWLAALGSAGVPAVVSESAGAFLCNHALFEALRHARATGVTTVAIDRLESSR